jgi:hypothetical protein
MERTSHVFSALIGLGVMGIQNVNAGAVVVADGHGDLSTGAIPLTAPLVLPSECDKTLKYGHLLIQAPDIRVYNRDYEGVWDGIHLDGNHASFFALRETGEGRVREKLLARCK